MSKRANLGRAAYFLVDLAALSDTVRQEVMDDATMGGDLFGVRVVEEVHNGPAVQPIFGVYYGPDEAKWAEAQTELDAVVEEETDEEREERLRVAAERAAQADGDAARAAEDAEIAGIVKEDVKKSGNKAR